MIIHRRPIYKPFVILSVFLICFIALPLLGTIFSISPSDFIASFSDDELLRSIILTLYASALATVISLISGIPLAYILARYDFPGRKIIDSIVDLPVIVPHTAAGIALLLMFGRQSTLGKSLSALGLSFTDSVLGIMIAMAFVSVPYLVTYARDAFSSVDADMEQAAMVDGASQWQVFWEISIPQAWKGISSGILMMWARGISEFGAVVILAYNPKILPVLVYERFQGMGLNSALTATVLLIIIVLIIFISMRLLLNKIR
jgi:molybdate/tungstate transport system permease protein